MDHLPTHTQSQIEDSDFQQVVNPGATILLPEDRERGNVIRHLSNIIPTNDYGLPLFYVRSDLLDWTRIESYGYVDQASLDNASEPLSYLEGYPTLRTGSPFWTQFQHEAHPDYLLFRSFLSLAESDGIRLLDTLCELEQVSLERVRQLSFEYYWSARARAYDLFIVAAEAKKREHRIRNTENKHFDTAGKLLETFIDRLNSEPGLIEAMDGPDLLDAMEKMIKVQRLSLGLTGAQASTNQSLPAAGSSVEVILRQMTKNIGLTEDAQGNFQSRLELLMGNEDTALMAQELVIRATTGNLVHDSRATTPPPRAPHMEEHP